MKPSDFSREVAKEIELKDKFQNMGAQMVKEVASKTSDVAGDGTTTAKVMAQCIYSESQKLVTAGANPMALKRGIDKGVAAVVKLLQKMSSLTLPYFRWYSSSVYHIGSEKQNL